MSTFSVSGADPILAEKDIEGAGQGGPPVVATSPAGEDPAGFAEQSPGRSPDELATRFLKSPPKELGVMLVSAGVVGFVLPGPGVPALVAGGLILWPEGFGKVEGWFRRRFPVTHRTGMAHLGRFLSDLERRYPGSTGSG